MNTQHIEGVGILFDFGQIVSLLADGEREETSLLDLQYFRREHIVQNSGKGPSQLVQITPEQAERFFEVLRTKTIQSKNGWALRRISDALLRLCREAPDGEIAKYCRESSDRVVELLIRLHTDAHQGVVTAMLPENDHIRQAAAFVGGWMDQNLFDGTPFAAALQAKSGAPTGPGESSNEDTSTASEEVNASAGDGSSNGSPGGNPPQEAANAVQNENSS